MNTPTPTPRRPWRLSSLLSRLGSWFMAGTLLLCTSLLALRVYEITVHALRHG